MRAWLAGLYLLLRRPDPEPDVPVLPVDLTRPGGDPVDEGRAFFLKLNGKLRHRRKSRAV